MRTSDAGIAFIKSFEAFRAMPYKDQAGLWTIGWGHLIHPDEDFTGGIPLTDADELFLSDLSGFEDEVNEAVEIDLAQQEFDALVSLAFNIGNGNFANSTLLKLLNTGDRTNAATQFIRWDYAGGKVSAGLMARRVAEKTMFEAGVYRNHAA